MHWKILTPTETKGNAAALIMPQSVRGRLGRAPKRGLRACYSSCAMEDPRKGIGDLGRIVDATRYSLAGLAAAVRHETAFRQELVLAAVFVPLGLVLGADGVERALLAGSILFVLVVELVNSAIEATVDRISPEEHPLAKRAKDLGSAAVMLALLQTGAVWFFVLMG